MVKIRVIFSTSSLKWPPLNPFLSTDTCNLLNQFRNTIHQECVDAYSISKEEDRDFQPGWGALYSGNVSVDQLDQFHRAFTYQSFFDLRGTPVLGKISLYGGGGYVAILSRNQNTGTVKSLI